MTPLCLSETDYPNNFINSLGKHAIPYDIVATWLFVTMEFRSLITKVESNMKDVQSTRLQLMFAEIDEKEQFLTHDFVLNSAHQSYDVFMDFYNNIFIQLCNWDWVYIRRAEPILILSS